MMTFAAAYAVTMASLGMHMQPVNHAENKCMVEALYFEAGNQKHRAKVAVGHVIFNRTISSKKDVCWVIKRPKQFSYRSTRAFRTQRIDLKNPMVRAAMESAVKAANQVLQQKYPDITNGARYYLNPVLATDLSWSKVFVKTVKIGDHVFYRDPKQPNLT